jgi:hypothetical protein
MIHASHPGDRARRGQPQAVDHRSPVLLAHVAGRDTPMRPRPPWTTRPPTGQACGRPFGFAGSPPLPGPDAPAVDNRLRLPTACLPLQFFSIFLTGKTDQDTGLRKHQGKGNQRHALRKQQGRGTTKDTHSENTKAGEQPKTPTPKTARQGEQPKTQDSENTRAGVPGFVFQGARLTPGLGCTSPANSGLVRLPPQGPCPGAGLVAAGGTGHHRGWLIWHSLRLFPRSV